MKELEVRPGLFILPMARNEFLDKIERLAPEDKQHMVQSANEYSKLDRAICDAAFLMNKTALTLFIQKENPTFNPETDFIFVSNGEKNDLPGK